MFKPIYQQEKTSLLQILFFLQCAPTRGRNYPHGQGHDDTHNHIVTVLSCHRILKINGVLNSRVG
jgi:hypothetical protein